MSYSIRQLKSQQFYIVTDWAKQQNWNPGIYDYLAFQRIDLEGFFVGEIDNKIVSLIAGMKYNEKVGFIAFFIVLPEFRQKGYGKKIFSYAMNRLGNINIELLAVPKEIPRYEKWGFQFQHFLQRYEISGVSGGFESSHIKVLEMIPFNEVVQYDQKFFGSRRQKYLDAWISMPQNFSFGYIQNNRLRGFAVVRKCFEGFKLSPLRADSISIAQELFQQCLIKIGEKNKISIGLSDKNKYKDYLVYKYKMKYGWKVAHMSTKTPHQNQAQDCCFSAD